MSDHLCVSCSLCCNGSLFARVPVSSEERARLGGGPDFFEKNGGIRMKQGCSRLGYDGACQCYDLRPETCRTYKCRLLKRVEAGETTERDAVEMVTEIKTAQKNAKSWIAKALGIEPQELTMTQAGAAYARMRAAEKDRGKELDAKTLAHAKLCYKTYVAMVQLHIKPTFLK